MNSDFFAQPLCAEASDRPGRRQAGHCPPSTPPGARSVAPAPWLPSLVDRAAESLRPAPWQGLGGISRPTPVQHLPPFNDPSGCTSLQPSKLKRKLRFREVTSPAQRTMTRKWQGGTQIQVCLTPKPRDPFSGGEKQPQSCE